MNKRHGEQINKTPVYIAAFLFITLISLGYKLFLSGTFDGRLEGGDEGRITVITDTEPAYETTYNTYITETVQPLIDVYICGAVCYPGVYEIESGSIINDVVILAGGFTDEADISRVNLVYIINENLSIYIPVNGEQTADDPLLRADDRVIWGESIHAQEQAGGLVNINTASLEQLMSLPGIGEVTANAILEYREQNHFERVEDIMNVTGIGEAKFNGIRDLICV